VINSLDVKENYEYALDFALNLSLIFRSVLNRVCHSNTRVRLIHTCLIIARVSVAFLPRFAQNLMLLLCRIYGEIASGHTRLQIKGRKNKHAA
jgi:hypothetical protein